MKIRFKEDVELEMVKTKDDNISFDYRKFKKGDIVDVEVTNIPWQEDWQFSLVFQDSDEFSSVNIKHFDFIEQKDIEEIEEMKNKYPFENIE